MCLFRTYTMITFHLYSILEGDPELWTADQVKMWLDSIDMGIYKARFGRINGKVLLRLTEERLDRLIAGDYADVIIICEAIADLKPLSASCQGTLPSSKRWFRVGGGGG